jgi:hypothetical protein
MSSQFRATTPADAEAISHLMRQVFDMPADHPGLSPAQLDWKYWRKHPDWEGSRSYVMERDGVVIAHGSVVPLTLAWGARRLRIVHLIDWAARKDATGAGIALMKRVGQMVDGVFAAGGSEMTEKILPALGFRESGQATRFALPLRPLARLRSESVDSWKPVARFARNLLWKLRAHSGGPQGWTAHRVLPEEIGKVPFPLPQPSAGTALFERTLPEIVFLLDCPAAPMELYVAEREGEACGYFVLALIGAQCRLVESWASQDWHTLYALAIREALSHPGIQEIATAASAPAEMKALEQIGFHACGQLSLRFWLSDKTAPEKPRFQLTDGDLAYLHDGSRTFWL